MGSLCFSLLLIGGALVADAYPVDVDLCLSQGNVDGINHPKNGKVESRRNTYIFLDQEVPCDGQVAKWHFFPEERGTFHASLWRRDDASGQLLFVGDNMIVADTAKAKQTFEVPADQRLYAQEGDVVGFNFDENPANDDSETVLGVEREDLPRTNSDVLSEVTVLEGVTAGNLATSGRKRTKLFPIGDRSLPRMSVALQAEIVAVDREDGYVHDTDYSVDLCRSKGNVDGINHPKNGKVDSRRNTYLFLDQVIPCEGRVGQWQFFPEEPGTFHAVIGRLDKATSQVLIVGDNLIVAETAREIQYFEVPLDQRVYAEVGDVVGIFFDEEPDSSDDNTVLSVERSDMERANSEDVLSEIAVLQDETASTISSMQGVKLFPTGDPGLVRMSVALKAEIVGSTQVMRFAWDDNTLPHGEGRVETFKGGLWGTVCDKWFNNRGWPFLFCREMGFPESLYTYYTDSDARHKAPADVPIHIKNPHCKPSQNLTMISCGLSKNQNCEDHSYDLYVICRKKVELRYGTAVREGIPFLYDHGYWGTICDSTDPDDIPVALQGGVAKQQLDDHWCNAFCQELDFPGCERVSYAKGSSNVTSATAALVKKYAISNQSPKCEVSGATYMDQCPSSPEDGPCNHNQDYFVVCKT